MNGSQAAIVAVAPGDPFAARTFSGYSKNLFTGIRSRGVEVTPVASRDLRWYDVLTGALNVKGLAQGRFSGRRAPRLSPDWYWSRSGFERFSRRLEARLTNIPGRAALLQVGTHVKAALNGLDTYCVTDCTIVQAIEGGEFAVSQTSQRVTAEAIECQREVFHSCRKVFTLSQWTAASVIRDYGLPADRVVVVGAGANLSTQIERRVDPANPYVLFVGMDWEQKGGPLLVKALQLVRAQCPSVRLKVVGCTPPTSAPGVDVIGFLPPGDPQARARLAALYGGASCFALMSRFDCFPNVLLEAQLAGVPVVTLGGQGRPEELSHGETGMLVERADPRLVAEALIAVLKDDAQARLGQNARQWARARFTWTGVVDRVLAEMGVKAAGARSVQ